MENELKTLKIILRAGLTKNEIKTVIYLLEKEDKVITQSLPEMALALGFTTSNMSRTIKNLKNNHIIADKKTGGIFVKSCRFWKEEVKKEDQK